MGEINQKRKVSFITELILFLFVVLISVLLLKQFNINEMETNGSNLPLYGESTTSLAKENEGYVRMIKEKYSINVTYGKNTEDYMEKIEGVTQYDEAIINNNLRGIYYALKKYPKETFDMTKSKKYPLNIIIISKFNNNNLALASRNNLNEFKIYISNTVKFERAFHHEMYHILEYYMSDTKRNLFSSWNNLNPENFKYEEDISMLDDKYVYRENNLIDEGNVVLNTNGTTLDKDNNPYFVTKYSKVTEKEDRAEVFAEVMTANKKLKYLEEDQNIRKKVDYITQVLKTSISNNEFYFYKYIS
ncbi:MAG: hypothetical protein PHP54_01700 [Clostridia bacterium]|nr:hypothetical protein [Clostridia bacterium]